MGYVACMMEMRMSLRQKKEIAWNINGEILGE
jgi:hypothetical protein